MSNITVNQEVIDGWLDVISDKIDEKPALTWTSSPSKVTVGGTILPTDSGAEPYVFRSASTPASVVSLVVVSGLVSMESTAHDLLAGEIITLSGAVPSQLNDSSWTISNVVDANNVEFNVVDISDTTATGTISFTRNIASKGGVEPVWPNSIGDTVASGKVTWTNLGPITGKIRIYSGTRPANGVNITNQTQLAELYFSDPSAPGASASVLTFSAITSDSSADATGVATWARALNCSDTPIFDANVSDLNGTGDIKLSSTSIIATGVVSISSAEISFE